jgi:glucokinase
MEGSTKQRYIVGVDVGGTKIATGLVNEEAQVIARTVLPTPDDEDVSVVMNAIYRSIEETLRGLSIGRAAIQGIGVVTPGPLDPRSGILFHAPNIPAFKDVPILRLIQDHFRVQTLVENDANAAGLAEAMFGAGIGYQYVLYVTVSTGIGTGIIIDRRIYHGRHGVAGEGGHVTIDYRGRLCGCGRRGCIEAYTSGPALTSRALERLSTNTGSSEIIRLVDGDLLQVTPLVISQAAHRGDELALELIRETGRYLAIWLGGMVNLLDPDIIVVGGGLSSIGELLFSNVRAILPNHTLNPFVRNIQVVPARLQSDVGILGAAALHMNTASV